MATAHNMDTSAANDVMAYDVTSLPPADVWTDGYVAGSATIKNDVFYCLSDSSAVQSGFTDDTECTVNLDGSNLLSDILQSDNMSSSSCHGASNVTLPHCWNGASTGQSTTFAGSLSCSESTSLLTDNISDCHPMSATTSVDVNSPSTVNGIHTHCHVVE